MSILSRYVLKQHAAPALAGLAIFYFVLSMDFLVDYLNLFIAKGVPGPSVLEAFMLSLAWMTFLAVPMAVMVSVLTAFGRLSADSEITAVKASGINILTLMRPVIIAGLDIGNTTFHSVSSLVAPNAKEPSRKARGIRDKPSSVETITTGRVRIAKVSAAQMMPGVPKTGAGLASG